MSRLYRQAAREDRDASLNITTPEEGVLALLMCVIKTAADDVRRHLNPPVPIHARRSTSVNAADAALYREKLSHIHACRAARFLAGEDATVICRLLAECGLHVPLGRILRELHAIKPSTPKTES